MKECGSNDYQYLSGKKEKFVKILSKITTLAVQTEIQNIIGFMKEFHVTTILPILNLPVPIPGKERKLT